MSDVSYFQAGRQHRSSRRMISALPVMISPPPRMISPPCAGSLVPLPCPHLPICAFGTDRKTKSSTPERSSVHARGLRFSRRLQTWARSVAVSLSVHCIPLCEIRPCFRQRRLHFRHAQVLHGLAGRTDRAHPHHSVDVLCLVVVPDFVTMRPATQGYSHHTFHSLLCLARRLFAASSSSAPGSRERAHGKTHRSAAPIRPSISGA